MQRERESAIDRDNTVSMVDTSASGTSASRDRTTSWTARVALAGVCVVRTATRMGLRGQSSWS